MNQTIINRVVVMAALLFGILNIMPAQMKEYPRWFIFPNEYHGLLIGMTTKGTTAQEDAAITATAYNKCIVDGTLRVVSKEEISFPHRSSDYFYYYSEEKFLELLSKLKPLDSIVTNSIKREAIVAFVVDSPTDTTHELVKTSDLKRPDWLDSKIFTKDGFYWSVGSYPSKGNENDSWKTAEERAIFAVLLGLELEVTSDTRIDNTTHPANEYGKTIDFKVKQLLKDISVVERYPDPFEKLNHVLIKLKVGNQ